MKRETIVDVREIPKFTERVNHDCAIELQN
ncbi:hypothetical protein TDB9533_03834 [Thalassocella blandensis]|nr:hypothetical protein TDB9533_03834 [Thalassocella blandensis]